MHFKNNIKQRNKTVQGLRSLKDTLPTSIKKIIKKKGHIFSETINNWKYIAGNKLFKICYPKSFKNSNKFSVSTLLIMVQRGHEVEIEYSKKEIMDRTNAFFKEEVIRRIKFTTFENENKIENKKSIEDKSVTNSKYINKLESVKNEKIKKSLIELTKVFKEK